jgi:hypothetical protein
MRLTVMALDLRCARYGNGRAAASDIGCGAQRAVWSGSGSLEALKSSRQSADIARVVRMVDRQNEPQPAVATCVVVAYVFGARLWTVGPIIPP